jgi:glucose-6-phosphate 1-dehydrogenase
VFLKEISRMAVAPTLSADAVAEQKKRVPDPCTVVILGAAGDLAFRKLIPSLFHLYRGEHLPENTIFVGVDKAQFDENALKDKFRKGHIRGMGLQTMMLPRPKDWDQFLSRFHFFHGDVTNAGEMKDLATRLDELEHKHGLTRRRVFYFSLPPAVFSSGLKCLDSVGLLGAKTRAPGQWARVIIEKPIGRDLASARELNATLLSALTESETYRIDHYLGKETVQNVLFFRFANAIFEPIWNHKYIDHVQISAIESLGCEGRAGYYDESGALRDMVQNHLIQLLALTAMEPPVQFDAQSIRDEKVKAVRSLRPVAPDKAVFETVRAQYTSGRVGRNQVLAYQQEEGVKPDSSTETFAVVRAYIDNWRWAGTPFYLRTGKRLAKSSTTVTVHFKQTPHLMFQDLESPPQPNLLTLQVQPNDGVTLSFETKVPGSDNKLKTTPMRFNYPDAFMVENPNAYERLLQDCMLGDQTLFIRSDEVEAAWKFITPIHEGWSAEDDQARVENRRPSNLFTYKAGSWGPTEADTFIGKDGRSWHNI